MTPHDPPGEPEADAAEEYAAAAEWFELDVPEFFTDTVNINVSPYGMSITFGVRGFAGPAPKARVFMSHELATVVERLLKRILRTHEIDNGVTIMVPDALLATLKLRDSDLVALESQAPSTDSNSYETEIGAPNAD